MTSHIVGMARIRASRNCLRVPPIVIYTKSTCPYCHAAKALLRAKAAPFEEIGVDGDRAAQAAMAAKANGRWTVPQIFIGETHVGGCDDLHDLEAAGELDGLLAG
jgi:glutaredoxin 3